MEPNYEAAIKLLAEQRSATGDAKRENSVRRKLRALAAKTSIAHEQTVLALDLAATRLGMGEPGVKGLVFQEAL